MQILQFVPDYKLNLLSPDLLDEHDFDKFRTGLGAAMQFLKHQHDDNMDWIQNNQRMQAIDRNTADFIQTTTGTDLHLKDDDEVINMCRAWENSMKQAEARGETRGEARLSRLISHLLSLGKTDEILSATKNDVLRNQLYEKYSIV